jgi:hypothetical protein
MKTNKIKKTLCLVMTLSLVAGWYHVNVCMAEEVRQSISESTAKGDDDPSLELLAEQNTKTTQDETKSEKSELENQKSDVFKNDVLPVVLIPLVPVSIGMQIVCLFVVRDFSRCVGH